MNIDLNLIFEESPDTELRKCVYCYARIKGKKYQAVFQNNGYVKATDLFICEKCYGDQKGDQSLDKT